ncbi:hypothetical protein KDA_63280 [Dictyobacter alpinus]|uniref:Adhesin domain-containing protein n=1 Tax=Dictyobacter alpinus TaxID=2014873 RepID=A0A402BHF1_9CHLR|nr:hypothetical protein [Dictyobacter alpinus]GCE30844.1 hypothetical protein KDA_63280 [Dictyobacter alpinus]
MSEQESMLYPSEEQSKQVVVEETYEPRALNADPREQSSSEQAWQEPLVSASDPFEQSYEGGYAGSAQTMGEKLRPEQANKNEKWIYLIVGICIGVLFASSFATSEGALSPLIIVAIAGVLFWLFTGKKRVIEEPVRSFSVQDMASLVVHNPLGSVNIHRGEAHNIVVRATRRTQGRFSRAEDLSLVYIQEGDRVTVNAVHKQPSGSSATLGNVDLDILVPANCDLETHQNVGSMLLDGIDGQLRIKQNIGSIYARNLFLRKKSSIASNIGSVKIAAQLDPAGVYDYKTNIGSVELLLPATTNFEVQTATTIGSFDNQFGSNVIGNAPRAHVRMHANIGSVEIKKN